MISLTLYSFRPATGEYAGSFQADRDPESDGFLVPWGATEMPPPATEVGQAALYANGQWSVVPDVRGATWYRTDGSSVVIDRFGDPATFDPPLTRAAPPPPAAAEPDGPTLSDWRVALTLWGRIDAVAAAVGALVAASDPAKAMVGKIAKERLEYANNVFRAQLLAPVDATGTPLCSVFGFTAADVDESMWRAQQVSKGDLSGVWPLPKATPAASA